jgi:hypothetical protein
MNNHPKMFGCTDCSFEINCSVEELENLIWVNTDVPPTKMVQFSVILSALNAHSFQQLNIAEQASEVYQTYYQRFIIDNYRIRFLN